MRTGNLPPARSFSCCYHLVDQHDYDQLMEINQLDDITLSDNLDSIEECVNLINIAENCATSEVAALALINEKIESEFESEHIYPTAGSTPGAHQIRRAQGRATGGDDRRKMSRTSRFSNSRFSKSNKPHSTNSLYQKAPPKVVDLRIQNANRGTNFRGAAHRRASLQSGLRNLNTKSLLRNDRYRRTGMLPSQQVIGKDRIPPNAMTRREDVVIDNGNNSDNNVVNQASELQKAASIQFKWPTRWITTRS